MTEVATQDLADRGPSARLLLAGFTSFLAKAVEHAFAPLGFEVDWLDDDVSHDGWVARLVDTCVSDRPFLVPVLLGHPDAWRILRPVNAWANMRPFVAGVGQGIRAEWARTTVPEEPLPLALNIIPSPSTLSDLIGGAPHGGHNAFAESLRSARVATRRDREILIRAALRSFASTRHRLSQIDGKRSDHELADRVAAMRFLQGAFLAGWIQGTNAEAAGRQIINGTPNADELLKLFRQAVPAAGDANAEFGAGVRQGRIGSLVLVDDEPAWRTAFSAVWEPRGLIVEHCAAPADLASTIANDTLVCVLDLRFPGDQFGGARILRHADTLANKPSLVISSIHDFHSVAGLLRRRHAFSYMTKRPAAEDEGSRDEISFFQQFRDTIILASFASLANQVSKIWKTLKPIDLESDPNRAQAFQHFVDEAMQGLETLCSDTLHGIWHYPGGFQGVANRESIRRLGLLHDQWCATVVQRGFNPDAAGEEPASCRKLVTTILRRIRPVPHNIAGGSAGFAHLYWPFGVYHQINNVLRNEASHAAVDSCEFSWLDCWIMTLTQILRADGLPGFYECEGRKDLIDEFSRSLWWLLRLSGFLSAPVPTGESTDTSALLATRVELKAFVERWRRVWLQNISAREYGEILAPGIFPAVPELHRVAIAPYALRSGEAARLIYEDDMLETFGSEGLGRALPHLLVLEMIAQRVRVAVEEGVERAPRRRDPTQRPAKSE